ncbi:hypothetical protein KY285_037808 [Solanum tuberosum]|nr:hypothetical protein KY285_037808 [Solanum tuberosum]
MVGVKGQALMHLFIVGIDWAPPDSRMSSLPPDYRKLPVEKVTVPSFSLPEDRHLCKDKFFKDSKIRFHDSRFVLCNWSWVGKRCLSSVEDQGDCPTCWAFVAAEAISALYHIKFNKENFLSKKHVIDDLFTVIKEPKEIQYHKATGCFPSHYNNYFQYAIEKGVYPDKPYPYLAERGECLELPNEEKTKIKAYKKVNDLGLDKKSIEELIQKQPICGSVKLAKNFQKHKGKDIYMGQTKEEIYSEASKNNQSRGRHAVLIIGFGIENGIEYYLIKNSWGVNWGYLGYARVERRLVTSLSFPVLHE